MTTENMNEFFNLVDPDVNIHEYPIEFWKDIASKGSGAGKHYSKQDIDIIYRAWK